MTTTKTPAQIRAEMLEQFRIQYAGVLGTLTAVQDHGQKEYVCLNAYAGVMALVDRGGRTCFGHVTSADLIRRRDKLDMLLLAEQWNAMPAVQDKPELLRVEVVTFEEALKKDADNVRDLIVALEAQAA